MLRTVREACGLTQDGWSVRLGCSRSTVRRWERGEAAPGDDAAQAIIDLCRERSVFRAYERGPLRGLSLTPEFLRELLSEARLDADGGHQRSRGHAGAANTSVIGGSGEPLISLPQPPVPRAIASHPNNLPQPATVFIGREDELADIAALLQEARLVTLTGVAGVGKTRLALEVARGLLDDYPDGVWLVELAAVKDPALAPQLVATVLGVQEAPGRPQEAMLLDYLASHRVLLIVDNCEHLLVACAGLISEMLRASAGANILATSRALLRLSGEHEFVVRPLQLPDPSRTLSAAQALCYGAVRLFLTRARAALAGFVLSDENAPLVAEICIRLDGLPLAIELAAARLKLFPPGALLARLDHRLKLLTSGPRDLPPRQQTLRNAIAWSHDLLAPAEQTLFRRLAAFTGGCTLDAAEAVCSMNSNFFIDVTDTVASLVDKSLLKPEQGTDGEPRFNMLQTIREYALERLAGAGEESATRQRHAGYYMTLVEEIEPKLIGADQVAWLDRLDMEQGNLRGAMEWLTAQGDLQQALRLGAAPWIGWFMRGHLQEWRERLTAVLASPQASSPTVWRAKALFAAGMLAQSQGDYVEARALHEESLAIARTVGHQQTVAQGLHGLGRVAREQGDSASAHAFFEESLTAAAECGDMVMTVLTGPMLGLAALDQRDLTTARTWFEDSLAQFRALGGKQGIAFSLTGLGDVARVQGDLARARTLYDDALAIRRELGDRPNLPISLTNLAWVALDLGNLVLARTYLDEALTLAQDLSSKQVLARALDCQAALAVASDEHEHALCLAGAADALRETIGSSLPPIWQTDRERRLAPAWQALGEDAGAPAWVAGHAATGLLPYQEQIAVLQADTANRQPMAGGQDHERVSRRPARTNPAFPDGLTAREVDVLRLIASGKTNRAIAEALVLSPATVERHISNLYAKIDARGRADATAYALRHGSILSDRP